MNSQAGNMPHETDFITRVLNNELMSSEAVGHLAGCLARGEVNGKHSSTCPLSILGNKLGRRYDQMCALLSLQQGHNPLEIFSTGISLGSTPSNSPQAKALFDICIDVLWIRDYPVASLPQEVISEINPIELPA